MVPGAFANSESPMAHDCRSVVSSIAKTSGRIDNTMVMNAFTTAANPHYRLESNVRSF